MALKDYAGAAIGALGTIGGWLGIGEKRQDQRQLDQQDKLNRQNQRIGEENANADQARALQLWKDTNYTAKLAEATKAGVSKAAAIGGAAGSTGGAGTVSAPTSSAADAASTTNARTASIQGGLNAAAQLNLMKAQADNLKADTADKLANLPVKGNAAQGGEQDVITKKFDNEVRKLVGTAASAEAVNNANLRLEAESGKTWNEYQAWKAAGFGEMENNDPGSPIAKAIKAGMQKTITDAENAKSDGNIKAATAAIEGFKARLAEQGLSPDTPWYGKLLSDILSKLNINPLDIIRKK